MTLDITQEVYGIRSISNVKLNPSIVEGTFLYESILGPDRAVSIERFAPTYVFAPVLSGSFLIPNTLTCDPGSVTASPQATFFYEWKVDGVTIISGANVNTFETNNSQDAKTITCLVTASNFLGSDSEISNGITLQRVEPVVVNTFEPYIIFGAGMNDNMSTHTFDFMSIFGVSQDLNITAYSFEAYSIENPEFIEFLPIVNPGAEDSTLSGWTVEFGSIVSKEYFPKSGSRVFGTNRAYQTPLNYTSIASQIIPIPSLTLSEMQTKTCFSKLDFSFFHDNSGIATVFGACYYQFLDSANNVISVQNQFGTITSKIQTWSRKRWLNYVTNHIAIPPNTVAIKIILEIGRNVPGDTSLHFDDISLTLSK